MKKAIATLFIILLFCPFSGCSLSMQPKESLTPCRVVTGITVTYENGPLHLQRHYDTNEKMQLILNYLRTVDPCGCPKENPADLPGSDFHIVLTYSDGQQKAYWQKADQYLQVEGQAWELIQPKKAQELSQLLGKMKSDA